MRKMNGNGTGLTPVEKYHLRGMLYDFLDVSDAKEIVEVAKSINKKLSLQCSHPLLED